MTGPLISVVVPFHNNEDLLGDCLRSIASQTVAELEVIMVDDGSTDGSAEVARRQAEADPRFTLISVPNGGPGFARNRGLEHVSGEFLAFVDADDLLPSHAFEILLHTLKASGSDFVSGGVDRMGPEGITPSSLHSRAIKTKRTGTHISRSAELFWDVTVWNKLFRMSFWRAHQFSFPEVMAWEDIPTMTRAHVLATAVDVVPDATYYWRDRGKGPLSITQSRTNVSNFRDRMAAMLAIDGFLRERSLTRLLREHQHKALLNDLWLYVGDLSRTSDGYQREFIELVGRYLSQADRRLLAKLPSTHKLAYHLIRAGQREKLVEYSAWLATEQIKTIPVVRRFGRLRADLPFRGDRSARVPSRVYGLYWRELDPFIRVEDLSWHDGRLVISGCAFVPSTDIIRRRHTSKIVILRPVGRRRLPIVIPARSLRHPDATSWSEQDRYSYDWAGFRCEISSRWFRFGRRWLTGRWDCYVLVRARGVWRPARLHTPAGGSAERPEYLQVAPGIRFGARWNQQRLQVAVTRTPAILRGCDHAGSELQIDVDVDRLDASAQAELVLVRPTGAATRHFPATVERIDGSAARIRAAIPVRAIAPVTGDAEETGNGGAQWDLYVEAKGQERMRVAFPARRPEYRYPEGHEEIAVGRTRNGDTVILRRGVRPVIDEHSWNGDGRLTLRGSYPASGAGPSEAVLRRRSSTEEHVVGCDRDGDRFVIDIPVSAMPEFGQSLPLRDGSWEIFVRPAGTGDGEMVVPGYDHTRPGEADGRRQSFGPKVYQLTTSAYDAPLLTVSPALKLTEQRRLPRKMLRDVYYPLQQKRPLRDAVFFVSWKGRQCADNPLAIAQELRRRGDDREHVWAVSDFSAAIPDGARVVLTGTEDYYEALARSRYLIANDDMGPTYQKRDGQVYVQTWHGTPLKRIGFDIGQPRFMSGLRYFELLAEDVAKWDLLISPNPFSTRIMRAAFRYEGEILESGYPRNDVLHSGGADRIAADVRRRLGLPDGKRVVLYAPTWRDNQYYASGRYRFDFRLDLDQARQELGDGYVFLVRGHHQMAEDVPAVTRPDFAINVTAYPDICELLLVTDILVTDYSSVMFDFAPTGRPMLFYTYDLEQYRDELRGFYIDFEAEAPGPLLPSSGDVVAAIADIGAVSARHRASYEKFQATFCPLDDGKAAARACDRIFGD